MSRLQISIRKNDNVAVIAGRDNGQGLLRGAGARGAGGRDAGAGAPSGRQPRRSGARARLAGYRYPHDETDAFVARSNLPEALAQARFYQPVERGEEREIAERLAAWRERRARGEDG